MIIEKIVIKSFGCITDTTLEFSDNVNVIEGQNEAGKSTIAAFIRYMLYGFEDGADDTLSERKKRINWERGTAQGSMYVKVKDKRYIITRSTIPTDNSERPSYREETSIVDLETGAPAFGKIPAGEVFFGVDGELFNNTAFIGQIGDSSINEGSVKQSIENILFSGSEKINTQRAADKITEKMQVLLHEGGGGGTIIDIAKKEQELDEKLNACNVDNRLILEKEASLHMIRTRRLEAEEKQAKLYELDSSYNSAMLIQTFDQLHNREEECEEKNEAYNKFITENTRADYVPDDQYLTDLVLARKGVNEAYHGLGEAQDAYTAKKNAIGITREIELAIERSDEMGGEKAIIAHAEACKRNIIRDIAVGVATAVAVIAAVVFEIIFASNPALLALNILFGILGVLLLACGGYFIYDLVKNRKIIAELRKEFGTETFEDLIGKVKVIADARAKRDAMALATENARGDVLAAREKYENAKKTITELIVRWGEEPPASELGNFLDGLEKQVRDFLDMKNKLYDEKSNSELAVREIRRNLADKSEIDVRAQVSPLKRKVLSSVNHDEIINGIADTKARIAEEDKLAFEVENDLMLLKGRAGDPGDYYARIDALSARREELQHKHKAYYVALQAIKGASDNLRAEIAPRLGEYATSLMEVMTDKKYTSFSVDDGLKVSFTDESGESKSIDFLSGGTRDMAYVAVRAALIDMLYTEKPPLCFDESFAHQDNVRAKAMMRAVKRLSEEGCQSFIFTCRGREAVLANELVKGSAVFKLGSFEE